MHKKGAQILIIDLGSQYTQIIRRSLRYLGFHSNIVPPSEALEYIKENTPKAIIFSGGTINISDADVPQIPEEVLGLGIPILGICLGMQWMAYTHDKNSIQAVEEGKSYGPVEVHFENNPRSALFENLKEKINAWSSHGDSVKNMPEGFRIIATSKGGKVAEGMENVSKKLYARMKILF
jgi:GMP synthase (glutamine-hydrolysing)